MEVGKISVNTLTHYANTSVQYTAIFHGCKNDTDEISDIVLIFAQKIDCGYTLEPPQ